MKKIVMIVMFAVMMFAISALSAADVYVHFQGGTVQASEIKYTFYGDDQGSLLDSFWDWSTYVHRNDTSPHNTAHSVSIKFKKNNSGWITLGPKTFNGSNEAHFYIGTAPTPDDPTNPGNI
jgi:type 1 fimbria pilin